MLTTIIHFEEQVDGGNRNTTRAIRASKGASLPAHGIP